MDHRDTPLLSLLQTALPIERRPFDAMAERLGLAAEEVLARVGRMVGDGTIRRIGPIFDSRRLGYVSTLVAARAPKDRLLAIAEQVNRLPGVTHNYERRGAYNLWFTLTARSEAAVGRALTALADETGLAMHSLPALATYKIRAVFTDSKSTPPAGTANEAKKTPGVFSPGERHLESFSPLPPVRLTKRQIELVRALQDNLAPEREPFKRIADRAGWTEAEVLRQIEMWLASGVLRRFGAVAAHRRLGYDANGMAVFRVADASVDAAGRALAARAEITHCYRRPPLDDFPFTLYAMIHGRTEEEVSALASRLAREIGAAECAVLFSVTEFRKSPMRYFEP